MGENNNHGLKIGKLSGVFVIATALSLILTGCGNDQHKTRQKVNVTSQQSSELGTEHKPTEPEAPKPPADLTADWQVFRDPDYPYVFKYPKNWSVKITQRNKHQYGSSQYPEYGIHTNTYISGELLDHEGQKQASFHSGSGGKGYGCALPGRKPSTAHYLDSEPTKAKILKRDGGFLEPAMLYGAEVTNEHNGFRVFLGVAPSAYGTGSCLPADIFHEGKLGNFGSFSAYQALPRFYNVEDAKNFMQTERYKTLRRIFTSFTNAN
ncbi:MAG: hypothetical protein Q4C71_02055 [Microbacteriaceae bacterium]|nr:hypothetical protein [Microbacteriaceae bacterium]